MATTKKSPLSAGGKITLQDVDKMDQNALKAALKDVIRLKGANVSLAGHQNHNSHGDTVSRVRDLKAKVSKAARGGTR